MSDTPRTESARQQYYRDVYENTKGFSVSEPVHADFARELERELAEAMAWIACVAPRYEALVLPHLEKPVEEWPSAVVGCATVIEGCPLERDEWESMETGQ